MCAKSLARTLTPQEEILKTFLEKNAIQFQAQKLIKRYIVDFHLTGYNLVIEVDGSHHKESNQRRKDLLRDSWLWRNGYKVVRIANELVQDEAKIISILSPYIKKLGCSRLLDIKQERANLS